MIFSLHEPTQNSHFNNSYLFILPALILAKRNQPRKCPNVVQTPFFHKEVLTYPWEPSSWLSFYAFMLKFAYPYAFLEDLPVLCASTRTKASYKLPVRKPSCFTLQVKVLGDAVARLSSRGALWGDMAICL
jgi:hypothetical protein